MLRHCMSFLTLLVLSLPATSQVKVQVKALNDAGFSLVRSDNTTVTKNFTANQVFGSYANLYHYERSPYTYLSTYVTGPYSYGSMTLNRFAVYGRAFARKGSGHKSMHLTGSKSGTPGAQRFEVSLTSAKSTNVEIDLSTYGYIYDNSTATLKLSGAVNKSWSWNKPGYSYQRSTVKLTVSGTAKITVELTGVCKPGPGSNKWYDGFSTSCYAYVREVVNGSFTKFGTGCGKATIRGGGQPKAGSRYSVHVDGAPAKGAVAFLLGTSKDWLHFIKLPLSLDYMGAKGCSVNVGFTYPWARVADANGHAEFPLYLSSYYRGTYHVQWVVFDKNANAAGLTTTKGATIKW